MRDTSISQMLVLRVCQIQVRMMTPFVVGYFIPTTLSSNSRPQKIITNLHPSMIIGLISDKPSSPISRIHALGGFLSDNFFLSLWWRKFHPPKLIQRVHLNFTPAHLKRRGLLGPLKNDRMRKISTSKGSRLSIIALI